MNLKKILYWLFVLFLAYLMFELTRNILGGSLGFEEMGMVVLIANLGYTSHIGSKLYEPLGWHRWKEESERNKV